MLFFLEVDVTCFFCFETFTTGEGVWINRDIFTVRVSSLGIIN